VTPLQLLPPVQPVAVNKGPGNALAPDKKGIRYVQVAGCAIILIDSGNIQKVVAGGDVDDVRAGQGVCFLSCSPEGLPAREVFFCTGNGKKIRFKPRLETGA
jgi:hypothetical protein